MTPGQVRYSLMCNEAGGVLDDVLVYQIHLPEGRLSGYGLVVNASNRAKIATWLPAPIWAEFMTYVHDGLPVTDFPPEPGNINKWLIPPPTTVPDVVGTLRE